MATRKPNQTITGDYRIEFTPEFESEIEETCLEVVHKVEERFKDWPANHILHERLMKVNTLNRIIEVLTQMTKEI